MIRPLTDEQRKQKRVVLDSFLWPGDDVLVCRNPAVEANNELPPDGTPAVVVGHHNYLNYVGRNQRAGREPGIYKRWGAAVLQYHTAEGVIYRPIDPCHLIFADPTIDPQQTRRAGKVWEMHHDGIRVGDLPQLPFYEGDLVSIRRGEDDASLLKSFPGGLAVVDSIDYHWLTNVNTLPQNERAIYVLSPIDGGFTTHAAGRHLELHERGNFYRYEKDPGQLDQLQFRDFLDQVRFYIAIDKSEQLRNPVSRNYAWRLEQVEQAMKEGKGAFITGHIFSPRGTWAERGRPTAQMGSLYFYDFPKYPELAAQCRALTLKAFASMSSSYRYNNEEPA